MEGPILPYSVRGVITSCIVIGIMYLYEVPGQQSGSLISMCIHTLALAEGNRNGMLGRIKI